MTDTGDGLWWDRCGNDRGPGVDLGVLGDHRLVCPKVLGEEKKQYKTVHKIACREDLILKWLIFMVLISYKKSVLQHYNIFFIEMKRAVYKIKRHLMQ